MRPGLSVLGLNRRAPHRPESPWVWWRLWFHGECGVVPAPRKYPPELRERAQRLVREAREQEPDLSLNAAVIRIGQRVGVNPDPLRGWVKQADIDGGTLPGTTTADAAAIRQLQAEVRELKRANK